MIGYYLMCILFMENFRFSHKCLTNNFILHLHRQYISCWNILKRYHPTACVSHLFDQYYCLTFLIKRAKTPDMFEPQMDEEPIVYCSRFEEGSQEAACSDHYGSLSSACLALYIRAPILLNEVSHSICILIWKWLNHLPIILLI